MDIIKKYMIGAKGRRTVLFNIGIEKRLTDALISLSLSRDYSVFVTVSNKTEADDIKLKFPQVGTSYNVHSRLLVY